ncbi:hypothetical protein [Desulfovibrio sp. TomC]|uniref:hypothetical protein n=1 Tax=Desulfovibrio sp. TomC TaxID=1562888 RepID=UPI00057560BC|nr:hypothetical protein [Desulfovibrio sp. TomC]KHK02926.1 hypothetical protein NY78_1455 [Desulfovibrio sp. TomC]
MKINLCSGSVRLPGWVNVDIQGADVNIDLERDLLPFPDACAQTVVCISALNYFTRARALTIVQEVLRILVPNGILRIGVQDLRILARSYLENDASFWAQTLADGSPRFPGPTFADKLNGFFYGFPAHGKACKYVYDADSLAYLLAEAGYTQIAPRAYRQSVIPEVESIDNRPEQMFFMEASKPQAGLLDSARELAAAGRNEPAWQMVLAAMDLDPGDVQARKAAATVALETGQPEQAQKALEGMPANPALDRLRQSAARLATFKAAKAQPLLSKKQLDALDDRPGLVLDDLSHLQAAMGWLAHARSVSRDRGVPAVYHLTRQAWDVSYPETTGYFIATSLAYARLTGDAAWTDAARDMGLWEIDIQSPGGGAGEPVGVVLPKPRVFNTGQVMLGWLALWNATQEREFLDAAVRAGDFVLRNQDPDGAWRRYVYQGPRAYKMRVAWALLELFDACGERRFRDGAAKALHWALLQAHPDGWFAQNSLSAPDKPWTHLIGYALVGLAQALRTKDAPLDREPTLALLDQAAAHLCRRVEAMSADGSLERLRGLPGTFGPGWQSADCWSAVTGNAQLAHFLLIMDALGRDPACRSAADALVTQCKRTQFLGTGDPALDGGLPGSTPVGGGYCAYQIPNWGVKFFADCFLARAGYDRPGNCLG